MKKFLVAAIGLITLVACNKVSEKVAQAKEATSYAKSLHNSANEIKNMQGDLEKLQAMEPLTNDELKAWLPEEILGMKRKSFKAGETAMLKVSSINASYADEEGDRKLSFTLTDGAGPVGASMIGGLRLALAQDFEEESDNGFRKTTTKNGVKAIVEKKGENSSIQLISKERFHLSVNGNNMDVDDLWSAIDEIKLNKLP